MKSLQTIFLILFLSACHHTYYDASTKNHKWLKGEKKELANAFVEINDYLLLLESMNDEALQKADKRETYLLSEGLSKDFNKLTTELSLKSTLHQVTLPDELSPKHDKYFHRLEDVSKGFDYTFQQLSLKKITELEAILERNIQASDFESIQKLSGDILVETKLIKNNLTELLTS